MFDIASVDCTESTAPAEFVRSMHETGFAVLRNHPIDPALIDRLYKEWAAFFASESKMDHLFSPETQDGYFPFRSENAKDSPIKDLKEFYHVYPNRPLPAGVKEATEAMYAALTQLGADLLGWLQQHTPDAVKAKFSVALPDMMVGSTQSLFRVLHYPPLADGFEPGAVRAAAHEDINLITLLVTGSEPGLQAKDTAGNWHDVPCDAGMIAVNGGDMLKEASGGYFPATTHRVVNPPPEHNVSRYSMPMFLHPRPDVRLSDAYTAGEYLDQRLREIGLKK
ncbi:MULTISPECIES: isopenicillin N synthase family dioxygenase [Nitrospirillum]|uniref:2-oxoglutarate-dependent ethylene/succinate-forming enzyme n=2 Tax=Nitrospirillum TaxID=1543705 RepID=A0A248JRK0_9PROT|nr:2OG-Fe(II) oxygenase family protein [Nitrospirillum amazonense]ASG20708.1 2OG-Fe(II) oxygenase [Nitrospirillum amazonense CBAmc]MDG3441631.1 2OG-Fe(II) oxygenase family protein [Nitrospirillum amazonense]TWB37969.1 isopenicillin N synthase-like dioxygenase [Nitrospirillum amazonense]TWB63469.1 isopenicillin N synthase-like dioxygenase [Nitrospirillum amazonense]